MQAFRFGDPNLFVQGIAELYVFDANGNVINYDNVLSEGSMSATQDAGEITGSIGNPLLINIPHSSRLGGTLTSQAFSLRQRALQTGGELKKNGIVPVFEASVAVGANETLTLPNFATVPPVRHYAQRSDDTYAWCYIHKSGSTEYTASNVGVDITSGAVQATGLTAGDLYDIQYFTAPATADQLDIPSNYMPQVASLMLKYGVYSKQNDAITNGSICGYLFVYVPKAQFTGDSGLSASQTSNATTSYDWQALVDNDNLPDSVDFRNCKNSASPYGFYVYCPCGNIEDSVDSLFVRGGSISVKKDASMQIPVFYLMKDGTVAQPSYSALTYTSATPATATVDTKGVVTGKQAGNTNITIKLGESATAPTVICPVTVTA